MGSYQQASGRMQRLKPPGRASIACSRMHRHEDRFFLKQGTTYAHEIAAKAAKARSRWVKLLQRGNE